MILAQVYSKAKPKPQYEKAIDSLQTVWGLYEAAFGVKSQQVAKVHMELARVFKKMKETEKAIEE